VNEDFPKLLFKYKPLSTIQDLERVIDILRNHQIYFPTRDELNDPLEGLAIETSIAVCGASMYSACDRVDPRIHSVLMKYRILSLSTDAFSPQLWAHYSNSYSGICIGYHTDNTFSGAQKVAYLTERPPSVHEIDGIDIDQQYFLQKESGWNYEKEWRIIESRNHDQPKFFAYMPEDVACVVFGYKTSNTIIDIIRPYIPKTAALFCAVPGDRTFKINLIPLDVYQKHNNNIDGTTLQTINDQATLFEYILYFRNNINKSSQDA